MFPSQSKWSPSPSPTSMSPTSMSPTSMSPISHAYNCHRQLNLQRNLKRSTIQRRNFTKPTTLNGRGVLKETSHTLDRHQRSVSCECAGFLYKLADDHDHDADFQGEYDGVIMAASPTCWYAELANIRDLELSGKRVSILGMDSPDTVIPPTWIEVMQLRDAFMEGGAKSVDYVHYERDTLDY